MSIGRALPLVAALLLAACHGDSKPAGDTAAASHAKTPAAKVEASQEELTAGMVEAVTVGKSTAPVTVKFDLPQRPIVGRPLDVVIAIVPQVATGPVMLRASGSAGLDLPAASREPMDIPALDPTQVYRLTLSPTPTADGVQLLGLDVYFTHDEITETRSFAVPVIVAGVGSAAE